MSLKASKTLFAAFSVTALLNACASFQSHRGLMVEICISDPKVSGFQCADKKGESYVLPFEESESYVALPYQDFEALMNSCHADKK